MVSRHIHDLPPNARELLTQSLAWLDTLWDTDMHMVRSPSGSVYEYPYDEVAHLSRETAQYALGLLTRNGPGDIERAHQAIHALLDHQFDTPDAVYHGTWKRAPQEPVPPANPREWRDYDPNWREFIGTALAVALIEYEPLLRPELVARIEQALRLAIAGTLCRAVPALYTNIALMCVFLLEYGAERFDVPAWGEHASTLAEEIYALYAPHETFDEYNSPTYYGVDMYALAIWRQYAVSPRLRELGAIMEAGLWRDIARFYHAGLHNLCGPFDRSYWMDIGSYASIMNLWIWLAVGREGIAFPDTSKPFGQSWDFSAAATYVLPGAQVPEDALPHLRTFQGERLVERTISDMPRRVASAWQAESVMIGAEDSSSSHVVKDQFHPATMHWRCPDGSIGWMRLRHTVAVDAWASPSTLKLASTVHPAGDLAFDFQIHALGLDASGLTMESWALPGLQVAVESDADRMELVDQGDTVALRYHAAAREANVPVHFVLRVTPA